MTPRERFNIIKNNKSCINCLSLRHTVCKSTNVCKHCQYRHHTMLHWIDNKNPVNRATVTATHEQAAPGGEAVSSPPASTSARANLFTLGAKNVVHRRSEVGPSASADIIDNTTSDVVCAMSSAVQTSARSGNVLLGTACVKVLCKDGSQKQIRILIDMGSQNHFITKQCCKRLGLRTKHIDYSLSVKGIGDKAYPIGSYTNLTLISSYESGYSLHINPFVLNKISNNLPSAKINTSCLSYLQNVTLADPEYNVPGHIDLLLGSEVFTEILRSNKVVGPPGYPDALETAFGFIIIGSVENIQINNSVQKQNSICSFFTSTEDSLEHLVNCFWSLQEVPSAKYLSPTELQCENFFKNNTTP
ncbi:uncharacterized protein LOC126972917 [Leptidea sinapis]|uniref:uncharacterized protein LOC126972917 n=1 Tax=Leptidea sinapis TaxID=189913 RepID=UPI0021C38DFF|nr:uncharacterized protein LOC126972917 [Leptidea sinapis]